MLRNYLVPNQKVEIALRGEDGAEATYSSWVEAVTGEFVTVAAPMEGLRTVFVPLNEEIIIRFQRPDALYWFTAKVLGRRFAPTPVLIVEAPKRLIRDQKRRFVRLDISVPAVFKAVFPAGDSGVSILTGEGKTRDLSGGGCCLATKLDLPLEARVFLTLRLSEKNIVHPAGLVRRKDQGPRRFWLYGIEFENLSEKVRDRIVAFIFEQQRKLRKKGLL